MAAVCSSCGCVFVVIFFLVFIFCVTCKATRMQDPRLEFHNHDVAYFKLFAANGRQKREIRPDEDHEDSLKLEMPIFGKNYVLDLQMNKHLLPESYFEKYHFNGTYIVQKPQVNNNHCHYHGKAEEHPNSWAALSTCRGISGVFYDGNETYYIHPESSNVNSSHLVFKASDRKAHNFTCGYSSRSHSLLAPLVWKKLQRLKRSVVEHEPYKSNAKTRYVELLIVNDHREFEKLNKDRSAVFERSKQIANIVNGLYSPFNIYIALVGVLVWSEYDEISLSSDGDATLTNFLHYRRERLAPFHPNDNAQLITGMTFDGGVVGKALKGPICTFEYSGGVNTDQNQVVALVATTVAHELGHNFGMEHDTDKCQCPDEKCIMAPSSSSLSPRHWSSCSYEHLREAYLQGMDYCLRNRPQKLFNGPVCGNGFLEEGEECDCGIKEFCNSQCCNATTCRLFSNATCATGSCCDMSTCQVKKSNEMCRNAGTECDLPERCDGKSEFCPEDVYAQNGLECGNGRAYCYEGQCRSHRDQCRLLWGETGQMSDLQCYFQNQNGNVNGHCGYNRINKTYKACDKEDVLCGMLHCAHLNERLEFGMESAALLPKSFMHIKGKVHACRSAIIDLGLDSVDPGLVPSGAKCGQDRVCVNQKCVPVDEIRSPSCPYNCYGNGVCNNKGECYCVNGFAPPYCSYLLPGAGYHITVAMYIIFLCILPLAAISVFIAYYFQENIKTWWLAQARKAVIKSGAKQTTERKARPLSKFNFDRNSLRTLEISAPIPHESTVEAVSTISQSSEKRHHHPSFQKPPLAQTYSTSASVPVATTNALPTNGTAKLVPVRAAPPPPSRLRPQRTPSWAPASAVRPGVATVARASSLRATDKNGRPLSISSARPSCPPPPRPPLQTVNSQQRPPATEKGSAVPLNHIYDDCNSSILDFSNTKLAFVHEEKKSPVNMAKERRINKPLPPIPNNKTSASPSSNDKTSSSTNNGSGNCSSTVVDATRPFSSFLNKTNTFNNALQQKNSLQTANNEGDAKTVSFQKSDCADSPSKAASPGPGQNKVKAISESLNNKIPLVSASPKKDVNSSFSAPLAAKPVKLSSFCAKPTSNSPTKPTLGANTTATPTDSSAVASNGQSVSRTNSNATKPVIPPHSSKPTVTNNKNIAKPNNSSFLHKNNNAASRTSNVPAASATPSQGAKPSNSFSSSSKPGAVTDAKSRTTPDGNSSKIHPSSSFLNSSSAKPPTVALPAKANSFVSKPRTVNTSSAAANAKPAATGGSFRNKTAGAGASGTGTSKKFPNRPETKSVGTSDKTNAKPSNLTRNITRTNPSLVSSMTQKFEQKTSVPVSDKKNGNS